uniref:Flagellar protein n=1 Tax=Candidatus Caldatribacterium saccharofermentans TaxID=1454753 RepID=A0A7V4TIA5_9BACT
MRRLFPEFAMFFALFPRVAFAEEELHLPEVTPPSSWGEGVSIVRFFLAFLVVAGMLWGVSYLLRRYSGGSLRFSASRYMRLLDVLPLRGNLTLYLLEVGKRIVVIAHTGSAVREVLELDAEDLVEQPKAESFSGYLERIFRKSSPPS